jgi:acetylornithine deacetylase
MPTIIVSCTVDEENGFRGAARLAKSWALDNDLEIPRPDAIIVLEPTGLDVVVAHKGVIRWKAHALGLASHSSSPQLGVNAIYKMARAVTAIEQYAGILAGGATHSSCGVATVSVGVIHGGTSTNIVPDQCTIEIDLRPLPGEDLTDARQRLLDHITHHSAIGLENETPYMQGPSLATEHNGPLARQLAALVQGMNGGCRLAGMSCCTNASLYADMGVPTVVFGPGFLEQAHTRDEWISVDQLIQATEIIDRFCSTFVV